MTTNGNKGTRQEKRSNKIKNEYVQKLSNEKALAEAILIGNKPCFAVVDFSDPNPTIGIMESLSYSENTRLIPELLSNRPYSFKNKEEFDLYVQRAKNETLDSLFDKTLAIWRKYIDADDFHLKICAGDTMFTYKQDILGMTHYLFFIADNDAGKSNNLSVLNIMGYRNLMSTSMTHANIYNFLGSKEEGAGTLCIDEADSIDQYPELMSILKPGYTRGYPVVRTLDTSHGRKQQRLNTFCFKAFAGERLPDAVEARGFMQRTIVLRCLPGYPEYDISEVISPAGEEEYQVLLNELNDLRNLLFCYFRILHFKDKMPNIKLNIRNREKQLFKPLLRMFRGTRTFEKLKPVINEYIRERRKDKANSFHAFLYRIVRDLIESTKSYELQSSSIWDFIKANLQWKEIPYKQQSIETVEFGVLSQKEVTLTLKNVFGAKPPKHTGSARSLVFSQHVLDRMKDTYEMDVEIEVDFETHGTLETHFGSTGNESNYSDSTKNEENGEENNENYDESNIKSSNDDDESEANRSVHSQNVSHVSQASQTKPSMTASDTSDSLIPRLDLKQSQAAVVRTNEDLISLLLLQQPQGQNFKKEVNEDTEESLSSPDPILAETTRLLKNLRERYDEYQCSKCQHRETIWKNNAKPLSCPMCKSETLQKR
jgi:ribosomal protein S27E